MSLHPLRATAPSVSDQADGIVECLAAQGVQYVFGVPGSAIDPLFQALARSASRNGPRAVLARHETGAAFMADGYARETGRLGVVCATTGPGITNLITGLACAHANEIPLLVLTGQPPLAMHGRGAFQDSSCAGIDAIAMLRPCTRYDSLVTHADQIDAKLKAALLRAQQAPRGPAHLSFPVDLLREPLRPPNGATPGALALPQSAVDLPAIEPLLEAIQRARSLVWLIGSGCRAAARAVVTLAEITATPFITTPAAKGLIDPRHPCYRGVFGFGGHASAATLLASEPDLVLAFGTRLTEWNTGGASDTLLNNRLIHIDDCGDHFLHSPMARMHVHGEPGAVARALGARLRARDRAGDIEAALPLRNTPETAALEERGARKTPAIGHRQLMKVLSERCPPGTRIVADAGSSTAWAVHCLQLSNRRARLQLATSAEPRVERRQRERAWLSVTTDFSPMGWAIGAAIGMARAQDQGSVVCITGDGSYLMSGQELSAAQAEGLPVVLIVLNDGAYGMVRHLQRMAGRAEASVALPPTDFALQAISLRVTAYRATDATELAALPWTDIFAARAPTLIDLHIDPDEAPPINLRPPAARS